MSPFIPTLFLPSTRQACFSGFVYSIALAVAVLASASSAFAQRKEDAKLIANDAMTTQLFGWSVAIDRDVAVVGAPSDSQASWLAGAAYVFRRVNNTWLQVQKLMPSDAVPVGRFGTAVSVSGSVIVVGAPKEEVTAGTPPNPPQRAGAVYVYRSNGLTWFEEQKIPGFSSSSYSDQFGYSVAVEGNTVVIGAPLDDGACGPWDPSCNSGCVYVYRYNGLKWNQTTRIVATDNARGDRLGSSVALSAGRIVAGAEDKAKNGQHTGAAYVFHQEIVWVQRGRFTSSSLVDGDRYGASVSIDGGSIVVGAPGEDSVGTDSGAAYLYRQSGVTWSLDRKLLSNDLAAGDEFGTSVDVDNVTIVVAALWDDHSGRTERGSAYLYRQLGPFWIQQSKLVASDAVALFANQVSVSDGTVFVGAARDPHAGPYAGSAYVYHPTTTWSFARADLNANGRVGFDDVVLLGAFLQGENELPCLDAADLDDDGKISKVDLSRLTAYLFEEGPPPATPFIECGVDPTEDDLGCESSDVCE